MTGNTKLTLGLIDSAWFGAEFEGQSGREQAREIGFESLDLFVGFDAGKLTDAERKAHAAAAQSAGLPVISVVCTCLRLNDFNPSMRSYHIERAKNVVEFAAQCPTVCNLCFVPSECMFQQKLLPPSLEWGIAPFEFALVNTLDTMERFVDAGDMGDIKATIDISRFWLQRIPAKDIERPTGRVSHVHISDCDGINHGDLPPGRGNTPFNEYLSVIRDTGYAGAASVELEFPEEPAGVLPWVKEAYSNTLRLLNDAGVH